MPKWEIHRPELPILFRAFKTGKTFCGTRVVSKHLSIDVNVVTCRSCGIMYLESLEHDLELIKRISGHMEIEELKAKNKRTQEILKAEIGIWKPKWGRS